MYIVYVCNVHILCLVFIVCRVCIVCIVCKWYVVYVSYVVYVCMYYMYCIHHMYCMLGDMSENCRRFFFFPFFFHLSFPSFFLSLFFFRVMHNPSH